MEEDTAVGGTGCGDASALSQLAKVGKRRAGACFAIAIPAWRE